MTLTYHLVAIVLNTNISDAESPQRNGLELYLDVEKLVANECDAERDDSVIKNTKMSLSSSQCLHKIALT